MKKRILWLYNHSTLMKSEVKILRELGYEVYIPKIPPFDVSIAIDWASDQLLTVPEDKLRILNSVDFYTSQIPEEAMAVMNSYFQMAIFGVFLEPLKSIVTKFKGIMIFHPFGLEDGMSYTKIIEYNAGIWLLKKIQEVGTRFWFGQSYENLSDIECDLFKKRKIDLPIGMVDTEIVDKWNGSVKKVLFICPRIRISPYYENIYKKFKEDFEDIPHSIGGVQPIPVKGDNSILGYLPQKEYDALYPSHSVMYYHSTNKRHVHYHPFEAVKCGLPLVFMGGGLLDLLGGEDLPGRCRTLKEAKKKCKRIIGGDRKLAEKIRLSQPILLEKMSYQYCKEKWREALFKIENSVQPETLKRTKTKMAFVLPQPYLGGVLDYSLRLISAFKNGGIQKDNIDVVFAVPEEMREKNNDVLRKIENSGIIVRTFSWETIDETRARKLTALFGFPLSIYRAKYLLMNDGISYFEDCNFLLFLSDRVPPNLLMIRPYGVVIHDYIRRYVPEVFPDELECGMVDFIRRSQCNFTTSLTVAEDAIQYTGLEREKIHLLPLFFSDISVFKNNLEEKTSAEYIVWATNISRHKNHKIALRALSKYYRSGGKFECYVTGVNTELFGENTAIDRKKYTEDQIHYVAEVREIIFGDENLKKNIHFKGLLSKESYYELLEWAQYMLHPGTSDNGNGAVVDAAFLGVPALSSDYPAMRNLDRKLNLAVMFFDKNSEKELCEKLLDCEKNVENMKKRLPELESLRMHSIENPDLCNTIQNIILRNIFL